MYHYVREYDSRLPSFRFLDVRNFERQLDFFEKQFGFVDRDEWFQVVDRKRLGDAKGKVLLTFDDGMSCHFDYVFKILQERGLWGIFYIPTQPYLRQKVLDVHRIHLLCGAFEGVHLMSILRGLIEEDMIPDRKRHEFRESTYVKQKNYEGVSEFKRALNYFVSYDFREVLIDKVADELGFTFTASDFYVSISDVSKMRQAGNLIGSHTVSHPVMSKLTEVEQKAEVCDSFEFLRSNLGADVKTYCHPYGGFHSFDKATIDILNSNGVSFSFNVESRDIDDDDLMSSVQFLPRYDCNEFPFGSAS